MKYGFICNSYEDYSYLLYILQKLELVQYNHHPTRIEIKDDQNNTFLLSSLIDEVKNCDKIFQVFNHWELQNYLNQKEGIHKLIFTRPGENVPPKVSDIELKKFLDDGNISISSSKISFEHKNFLSDYALNMYYFYNYYGYGFLNFYPSAQKNNLLGVYYQENHITGCYIKDRSETYEKIKNLLESDLCQFNGFKKQKYPNDLLLSYNYFSMWEKNFVASYTDYNTSVCNIIFETCTVLDGNYTPRDHITEKTLKCLLFSGECNIFFIWVGSPTQYKFLKEHNFWALNFENLSENPTLTDILDSAISCANYLKGLKNTFNNDNNKVYQHLLQQYKKKLVQNKHQLSFMLNNCSEQTYNKFIDLITGA